MTTPPNDPSREFIARIEAVFGIGSGRLSLPYEYGRTLEQHEEFGRYEALPGRRNTSRNRHHIRAVRVPLVREVPGEEVPYVYRGSLTDRYTSPEVMPDGWWRRDKAKEPPEESVTTEPPRLRPVGPAGPVQITRHQRTETYWQNGRRCERVVDDWYEVRPSLRTGRWWMVDTDADPTTGRATYATCSCHGYPGRDRIILCEHVKPVLRLIRDGVKIGSDYS